MMRLLIRADDIGYCQGVNDGIAAAVAGGLVGSAGLMPNMPLALEGWQQLKQMPVCIGQHTNLCLGIPCTDPALIPSLVEADGTFHSSRYLRQLAKQGIEPFELADAVTEVEAQYRRFLEIVGKQPAYFEAHAIASRNLSRALAIVAAKYHLPYSDMVPMQTSGTFCGKPVHQCAMHSTEPDYDPFASLQEAVHNGDPVLVNVFVTHPGYVDQDLLTSSSLTYNREKEVKMLCDPATGQWLQQQNIRLVSYADLH